MNGGTSVIHLFFLILSGR